MFTVLLKVATCNIVKGHNLLMHVFCYMQKRETSGKLLLEDPGQRQGTLLETVVKH